MIYVYMDTRKSRTFLHFCPTFKVYSFKFTIFKGICFAQMCVLINRVALLNYSKNKFGEFGIYSNISDWVQHSIDIIQYSFVGNENKKRN